MRRKIHQVIIEGIENFIFESPEEKEKTVKKRTAKTKKKKIASPGPPDIKNFGWLLFLRSKKTSITIKCRSGKLQSLANIIEEIKLNYPKINILVNWLYKEQPARGWVPLEIKITGRDIDDRLRVKIYEKFETLIRDKGE